MYDTLLREFRQQEKDEHEKFLRVKSENFDGLLALMQNDITKDDNNPLIGVITTPLWFEWVYDWSVWLKR